MQFDFTDGSQAARRKLAEWGGSAWRLLALVSRQVIGPGTVIDLTSNTKIEQKVDRQEYQGSLFTTSNVSIICHSSRCYPQ